MTIDLKAEQRYREDEANGTHAKWARLLKVERAGRGGAYRLMFKVGVQSFMLAYSNAKDAKEFCQTFKDGAKQIFSRLDRPKTKWSVKVDRFVSATGLPVCHRALFGSIVLAVVEDDLDGPRAAKQHCEFIAKMFLQALANLGYTPPKPKPRKSKNPHSGSTLKSLFVELGEWDEVKAGAKKKIKAEKSRRKSV